MRFLRTSRHVDQAQVHQVAQAVGFFDQPAVQVAVKDPVRRSMNSKPERYKSLYLRLFSNLFGKHSPDISSLEPTSDATHLEKTPFDGTLPSPIAGWMGSYPPPRLTIKYKEAIASRSALVAGDDAVADGISHASGLPPSLPGRGLGRKGANPLRELGCQFKVVIGQSHWCRQVVGAAVGDKFPTIAVCAIEIAGGGCKCRMAR